MKIISWNLNGLLSCLENNAFEPIKTLAPDVVCLQEIRTQQEPVILPGYHSLWNHSLRDGYSGTAILSKVKPCGTSCGMGGETDEEGRVLTLDMGTCYVVNAYAPNSQKNLQRRAYRIIWDEAFRQHTQELLEDKPVILCGDFNVTRSEIDIYAENMRQVWAQMGYASDERSNLETLLEDGFVDAFRHFHPDRRSYTWWSNRLNKRGQNRGWRLDYFLVAEELMEKVVNVEHLENVQGSDHCPIMLEVDL